MKLYVNGDSHSAGHEAGGPKASYGFHIANHYGFGFICEATIGCSNHTIIRTTKDFLNKLTDYEDLIILIGWTDWFREEWLHEGKYVFANASGRSKMPEALKDRYTRWVIDQPEQKTEKSYFWHNEVWQFHRELSEKNIKHLFFNSGVAFNDIAEEQQHEWGNNFYSPYALEHTYRVWLDLQGFIPTKIWAHYGPEAHQAWANHLIPRLTKIL